MSTPARARTLAAGEPRGRPTAASAPRARRRSEPTGAGCSVPAVTGMTQAHGGDPGRKARGAFFTPPGLCDHITRWAVRDAGDAVLEPSCGDAEFLVSAARRLRDLGAADPDLIGVEVHPESASRAAARLRAEGIAPRVDVGDFFARPPDPRFDAVVGNPPYVRYQEFRGEPRAAAREAALAAGVRLTALASSWAAFTVHAALFLRPAGRLALVLPAELLSVNYAADVRAFLMRRFARVRLVMFAERVFPGVQEEVVLLLAEGQGPTDHCELTQARDLADLEARGGERSRWAPPDPAGKWTDALVDEDARAAYADATSRPGAARLLDWGETTLGTVTGNNRYFAMTLQQVVDRGLAPSDIVRISPPGSAHLRPILDLDDARWSHLAESGAPAWLLCPSGDPSPAARAYFDRGIGARVHEGYKCRMRHPWWRTPLLAPPDLLLTYMNADAPRLVANSAAVHHVNSVHGVYLRPPHADAGRDLLPVACLNSLTLLGSETVGRAYGGGVLKLEPREADALPVPSPELVAALAAPLRAARDAVAADVAGGRLWDAVAHVDRVVLADGLGLDDGSIARIAGARAALQRRRAARGRSRA